MGRPTALSPGPRGTAGGDSLVRPRGSAYALLSVWRKARMIGLQERFSFSFFFYFLFFNFLFFPPGALVLVQINEMIDLNLLSAPPRDRVNLGPNR